MFLVSVGYTHRVTVFERGEYLGEVDERFIGFQRRCLKMMTRLIEN
jgi:hypothetical protein